MLDLVVLGVVSIIVIIWIALQSWREGYQLGVKDTNERWERIYKPSLKQDPTDQHEEER